MSDEPGGVDEQQVILDQPATTTPEEEEHRRAAAELTERVSTAAGMRVKVHSPFQDYYDGQAFSVSAVNATGPFDILPRHHNFISLLTPCDLVIRGPRGEQRIRIGGGLMHVKADKVIIFLDI